MRVRHDIPFGDPFGDSATGDCTGGCTELSAAVAKAHLRPRSIARVEPVEVEGWAVVVAAGEIDVANAGELRSALVEAVGRASRVVVDLSHVTFLDCAGLSALAMGLRTARRRGGVLRLVAEPNTPVTRLLVLTGLDRVFDVHASFALASGPAAAEGR
jgi:anti-sigma B factor antagonist